MSASERGPRAIAVAGLLSSLFAAGALWYVSANMRRIESLLQVLATKEVEVMQVKVSSWYTKVNGACVLETVSTPKGGMTDAEWQQAHRQAVADMMADYPPASDCPAPH